MSAVKKVNLNSVNDLRTATDDHLAACMGTLGFEQSFTLSDTKLALGFVTVAIAGAMFYLDKKTEFYDTFYLLVACIVAYAAVSGVLFYLNMGSEKNNKYVGYKDNQKVAVYTWTSKYDPVYHMTLVVDDKRSEWDVPFTKFFDSFGYFNQEAFTALMSESLAKKSE